MAIEIEIRKIGKVTDIKIGHIIGNELVMGSYDDNWRFEPGKITTDVGVFDPKNPGRGIMVHMDPNNRGSIKLKLPVPAATSDIDTLISTAARMAEGWGAMIVSSNGDCMPGTVFAANAANLKKFNYDSIRKASQDILDGKAPSFCVFGAKWPVFMGEEEAQRFVKDPEEFGTWLINRQKMDAYYAGVSFFKTANGTVGRYTVGPGVRYIFPKTPRVPYGFDVECNDYAVLVFKDKETKGEVGFEEFLGRLPEEKVSEYDIYNDLIAPLTEEEAGQIMNG